MASLNINGLRSHIDEIKLLLNDLKIDVLALNETKLDDSINRQITKIAGFKQVRLDRSRQGGGVSLYVRDSIQYILRNNIPNSNLELLCIEVQPYKSKPFLLIAWYRPPNDPVTTFQRVEVVLSYLDSDGKEMILMGDTNCDLSKDSIESPLNSNSRRIQRLYEMFSLQQIIKEPTRVTLTTSTLIDHIATSCIGSILEAGVHKITLSDHYIIFCMRKLNAFNSSGHKTIRTRNMKKFNEEAFLADVAKDPWDRAVSVTDDVDSMVEAWSYLFSFFIEKYAPIRDIRVSDRNCPWVNSELKAMMKSRDRLKKAAVSAKSESLMRSYREARNKVNSLKISRKKNYYKDRISQHSGNMKETWKITNDLLNKRSKSTDINSLNVGNIEIVDKRVISNSMNSYFCSVGEELANKIEDCAKPLLTGMYTMNKCSTKFHFNNIQDQHIRDAMAKVKTSKGFGNDKISSYFLNLALPIISKSLTCLFNRSISQCKFPASWKIARVTPIFKDGDKSAKENYRPISVLPVISRLFEKIIYNQLYKYLNSHGFLSSNQSGFRALHSTLTALLKNTDDWYSGMDLGKYVGTVFIDLKKAFDTVDHVLLQKLNHYGVQGLDLKWFESYLSNRKQFTRIDGIDSSI